MRRVVTAATILSRLANATAAALVFAALPLSVELDAQSIPHLEPSFAHADQGGGNSGPGGGGNSGPGGGGNSGPGGGDDDVEEDDEGGPGGGGSGGSGGGGSANGDRQGTGCRDGSGSGGRQGACGSARSAIVRIEASRSGIEIRYADGSRERIHRGRYERRDRQGRVVEDRRATGADVSRLRAIAQSATIESIPAEAEGAPLRSVSADGREAELRHANGWVERIKDGRYELIDPYGRTAVRRPATSEDRARVAGVP
ncbi:MAG: hypothetical protein OEM24_12435 [Paracoccaceae bacterium]|nr:hypothetical protein [Paracoccaceae bacterium]